MKKNNNLVECDKCKFVGVKELFNKCYEYEYQENKEAIDAGWMKNVPILCVCNKCWDGRKFTDCNSYWSKKECNHLDFSKACLKCPRNTQKECVGLEDFCNSKKAIIRKQNTAYVQSCFNYVLFCDKCMKENEEHWKEMWSDYYSQVL